MKLLIIHASRFWWRIREMARGLRVRDEPEPREAGFEDVMVVFTAVEAGDAGAREEVVRNAADAVLEFSGRVGCSSVVLYPYAHLTTNLARPDIAIELLRGFERALSDRGLNVARAPFGYYKEYVLHCRGHPLSEAFRDIGAGATA